MENHHFQWENPLEMVIFNSYVKLPEGSTSICWILKISHWSPGHLAMLAAVSPDAFRDGKGSQSASDPSRCGGYISPWKTRVTFTLVLHILLNVLVCKTSWVIHIAIISESRIWPIIDIIVWNGIAQHKACAIEYLQLPPILTSM